MKKHKLFGIMSLLMLSGCSVSQENPIANDNQYSSKSEQFSSMPNFTSSKQTEKNVYLDKKHAFEITYPDGWYASPRDSDVIEFGQTKNIGGHGYDGEWLISAYSTSEKNIDQLIADTGSQFGETRKEKREQVTIDGISATKVIVTTTRYSDWISESVIFEKNRILYRISNGAIANSKFEDFYKSFRFL